MNKLAKEITRLREKKNLSKRALSNYSKVSDAYIVQIESGKVKSVGPDILKKLAPALDASYEHLMSLAGYISSGTEVKESQMEYFVEVESLEEKKMVEEYRSFLRRQTLESKETK